MASNSFGTLFRMTTWGESHGKAIGVVIDGCPAGLDLHEEDIQGALQRRAPGITPYTSPRKEPDEVEILSGVFEGKTTGTPLSLIIWNRDADSSKYVPLKDVLRPGHANYTYLEKYGIFDYRGGGRTSARETVGRVAAGAIAAKILALEGVSIKAYIHELGGVCAEEKTQQPTKEMMVAIESARKNGDTLGGIIAFEALGVPVGWGEPVYEKLEANLAKAMLSINATKGFEIGSGFEAARMRGSEHNDLYVKEGGQIRTRTNHSGGVLAGISNGMPITGRVAFKAPSSIQQEQQTLSTSGEESSFSLPTGSRMDPCVLPRAVPIVEAMVALVLVDALLLHRCTNLKLLSVHTTRGLK